MWAEFEPFTTRLKLRCDSFALLDEVLRNPDEDREEFADKHEDSLHV